MTHGFKDDEGKFHPTEKKHSKRSPKNKSITPEGVLLQKRQTVTRDFSKVIRPKIKPHVPDGDVQGSIDVDGHTVEYGDEGVEDAISDFRDKNGLWKEVLVTKDSGITRDGERLEEAMKMWGETDMPSGSVYLTRDGTWIGGESVLGYDEDHRPQIRMGLRRAGIKIIETKDDFDSTLEMNSALLMSGIIRASVRKGLFEIDVYQPLSNDQQNAIQDEMINRDVSPTDLVIDAGKLNEERIRRMFH